MQRATLLNRLAERIDALTLAHPARVAVDGFDAAGKTTLADELTVGLHARGRPVIRASIDGFHRPRSERYRRGATSAEGYYLDSFDYPAVQTALLLPLGPAGSGRYRRAVFDFQTDRPLATPDETAPPNAVLVMDGVFLLRPELEAAWDYRIWVEVPFAVALQRARARDVPLMGSEEEVLARYKARYFPGQLLYLQTAHPHERADAIVSNADPLHPGLKFRAPPRQT
jgi:uridine kinase